MGLSRTVSDINGDTGKRHFIPSSVLNAPVEVLKSQNFVTSFAFWKTRMMTVQGVKFEDAQ